MELTCEECGAAVVEGDAFCGECGAAVVQAPDPMEEPVAAAGTAVETELCGSCGGALTAGESFCPWCGVQVAGAVPPSPPQAAPQAPPPPVPPQAPPPQAGAAPGGQGMPAGPPAASDRAAAAFSQGTSEASERLQRAWSNKLMRAPMVFLGLMTLGFLLPLASGDFSGDFGGSVTISDITTINVVFFLVASLILLVLLVLHATAPNLGFAPILVVAGVAFVLAVLTTIVATLIIVGTVVGDSLADEVDGSASLGLGTIFLLLGSVGLFVTSSRLSAIGNTQ